MSIIVRRYVDSEKYTVITIVSDSKKAQFYKAWGLVLGFLSAYRE
jgi:hypothetical protein